MDKLEKILAPAANALNNNTIIQTISKALMSLMPILMVGAFASLIQQIPFAGYLSFIKSTGIYALCGTIVNITTNMLALYAVFAIGYTFAKNHELDGFTCGLLSLLAFFMITPITTTGTGWTAINNLPLSWLGSKGLFSAMIVGLITSYIYKYLIQKNITIKMPESVPTFVSKSFTGIIPGLVIAIIFGIIASLLKFTPYGNLHVAIYGLIATPLNALGSNIWVAMLIYILSGLCWFFGIHGIAVMSTILPIWMAADAANIAAVSAGHTAPNIITYNWVNSVGNIGGAGCTIGLIILCCFFAKSERYKEIGKLAIVPSCFGINEPVVFGLPCMLNVTLAIPFILLPVVLIGISYVLVVTGILPVGNGVGAATAIPIFAGLINGGWRMALWNMIEIVFTILAYFPFFKILDKEAVKMEANTEVHE